MAERDAPFDEKLEAYEAAYAEFNAIVADVPAALEKEGGVCGEWSAWDVIAHMNGWFVEGLRRFRRFPKGTGRVTYNDDAFNNVSLWLREGKDFEDLRDEFERLSTEFVTVLQALQPERIEREGRYGEWVYGMTVEFETHGAQLAAFLEAQAT